MVENKAEKEFQEIWDTFTGGERIEVLTSSTETLKKGLHAILEKTWSPYTKSRFLSEIANYRGLYAAVEGSLSRKTLDYHRFTVFKQEAWSYMRLMLSCWEEAWPIINKMIVESKAWPTSIKMVIERFNC